MSRFHEKISVLKVGLAVSPALMSDIVIFVLKFELLLGFTIFLYFTNDIPPASRHRLFCNLQSIYFHFLPVIYEPNETKIFLENFSLFFSIYSVDKKANKRKEKLLYILKA